MAMNIGNSSASDEPELMMEINTTPLIDVMLVLLVMLIITIPIQLHAVSLEMPVGAPPNQQKMEKIQIDIDASSVVYWNGVAVSGAELEQRRCPELSCRFESVDMIIMRPFWLVGLRDVGLLSRFSGRHSRVIS